MTWPWCVARGFTRNSTSSFSPIVFDSHWARLLIDAGMSYSAAITVRLSLYVSGASYVGDSYSY